MSKKYQKIPGKTGIRKCLTSGNYEANKTISGKRYTSTFRSIKDASRWRREFHPGINNNPYLEIAPASTGLNQLSLRGEIEKYRALHLESLEPSSREAKEQRLQIFFNEKLLELPLPSVNSAMIDSHLEHLKGVHSNSNKRTSFNLEIKEARCFFN